MQPVSTRVMNLAHFVTQAARRFPDRAGLIWGERHWTWREIDDAVSRVAAVLRDSGVAKEIGRAHV